MPGYKAKRRYIHIHRNLHTCMKLELNPCKNHLKNLFKESEIPRLKYILLCFLSNVDFF
jgi:hypothetical protein